MIHDAREPDDERLAALLCQYEQLLTADTRADGEQASVETEDPVLSERLHAAQRGVAALERARRRYLQTPNGSDTGESQTPLPGFTKDINGGGTNIGRFRIERELGFGGVGVVFLAYDPAAKRHVALKVPRPESVANTDLQLRFLREAEAASRLNHPNITGVLEVGQVGPICFLASEFCSGPTLRQWLDEHPAEFSAEVAAQWVQQLASAVKHAHRRGVLHRDIKPSNVMLVHDGTDDASTTGSSLANWTLKLADFGMAKLIEANQESCNRTQTGTLIGTLSYMAPEQAEGRTADIDVRTDVYGLGALLYELLTGRPPAHGATDADTLRQVLFSETIPPSRIREAVPRDLEAICLKCLHQNPRQRYTSAQDLEADLQRYLAREPIEARPPSTLESLRLWTRRRPVLATLSLVCCLALVALIGFGAWYNVQLNRHYRIERQLRLEAQQHRKQAETHTEQAIEAQHETQQLLYISKLWRAHEAWKANSIHSYSSLRDELTLIKSDSVRDAFASRYFDQLGRSGETSIHSGGPKLFAVTFIDESTIATGDHTGNICLWDRPTGTCIRELKGHSSCVNCIDVSSDGSCLASASCDETIGIWDLETGQLVRRPKSPQGAVGAVRFSDEAGSLISLGIDHSVRLLDGEREAWSEPVERRSNILTTADVSPDAQWAAEAAVRPEQAIIWWNTQHGKASTRRRRIKARPEHLAFNHAGTTLAAVDASGNHWLWNPEDSTLGSPIVIVDRGATSIAFSHDDRTLAVAGRDLILRLIDVKSRAVIGTYKGHSTKVNDIAFSPNDEEVAVATESGEVRIWQIDSNAGFRRLPIPASDACGATLSADGRWVVIARIDGSLWLYRLDATEISFHLTGPESKTSVRSLHFSADSNYLLAGRKDETWSAWELSSGTPTYMFQRDYRFAGDMFHSRAVCATNHLQERNPENVSFGTELLIQSIHDESVLHRFPTVEHFLQLRFDSTGERLIVCTSSSRNYLWDLKTDRKIGLSETGYGWAKACEVSPAGDFFAIAFANHVVLYRMLDGYGHAVLHDQNGFMGTMAFSPDGQTLATNGGNSKIRLWHVPTGEEMLTLDDENRISYGLSFSEDGRTLYSVGIDENHEASVLAWPTE